MPVKVQALSIWKPGGVGTKTFWLPIIVSDPKERHWTVIHVRNWMHYAEGVYLDEDLEEALQKMPESSFFVELEKAVGFYMPGYKVAVSDDARKAWEQ